jgi:GH25 family lysozyme M1 (1,4-beta-N-acetylmuramidase)
MSDQPLNIEQNKHADNAAASDALRNEYIASKGQSQLQNKSIDFDPPPLIESKASIERRAQESAEFHDRFLKNNTNLDHFKPGWGPFQALKQLVKDGKLDMTEEQIQQESKRIRDRDFKELGRNYYTSQDSTKLWTDKEIDDRVDALVNKPKGIDVSAHQGNIDWTKVKDSGYQFAFLKATEGIDWVDSKFAEYRDGARNAGLKVGYYHFFRPNDTVKEQVDNFVKTVGKVEPDALRVVIDTEIPKIWKPYSADQRVKMITEFCDEVQKQTGIKPSIVVYGSPNFFDGILNNSDKLKKYDLWIANYNVPEPTVPKPWDKWTYWQYSEHGKVPGIDNNDVDLDVYNGDQVSFRSHFRGKE